jgi:hypothetical protein
VPDGVGELEACQLPLQPSDRQNVPSRCCFPCDRRR